MITLKRFKKANASRIVFKLADTMKDRGYNKNMLCVQTGLRFETIQGYYNGTITRVDLFVISEFCRVLKCNVQDIIEYKPGHHVSEPCCDQ